MKPIRPEQLARLRSTYPPGTRVALVRMDDVQAPPIGTQGTVTGVDDFDVPTVQRLAYDRGYYELVCNLEEHRGEYAHFILTGEA